ncbi:unnamed protein product [Arctia plantaginis]|uniref:Uncharacterized protein n=1 Tax=Arctia plantaginis TaxID=874455 RepID=A0A8S1B6Y4_ARCPL|nr:unnamed protein product [Arctia plantaginis]CAB3253582.1 unnamed protein product [Arctia plantaginis]
MWLSLYSGLVYPYETTRSDNCLWHNYSCVETCPDWMIVVKSDCTKSYWLAQRTCDNPQEMLVGTVCGFSRCDCPDPTVLDTDTGVCYDVDNCPTKHI